MIPLRRRMWLSALFLAEPVIVAAIVVASLVYRLATSIKSLAHPDDISAWDGGKRNAR